MTNPVIPAEAVEAAAKVLALTMYHKKFEGMDDYTQGFLRDVARTNLEAAGPYMLATVWKEGEAAGQDNAYAYQDGSACKSNPYNQEAS